MDFSAGSMFASLVVSAFGIGLFIYGKKQVRPPQVVVGIAMMVFPYFVGSPAWMLGSCALEWNGAGPADALAERIHPAPESKWNVVGVWKRVGDSPPTFLPAGCSASDLLVASRGQWITDQRDGKRFFVPEGGTSDFTESVLLCDAKKHCNPPPALLVRKGRITPGTIMDTDQ